jgi:hypothetical protein
MRVLIPVQQLPIKVWSGNSTEGDMDGTYTSGLMTTDLVLAVKEEVRAPSGGLRKRGLECGIVECVPLGMISLLVRWVRTLRNSVCLFRYNKSHDRGNRSVIKQYALAKERLERLGEDGSTVSTRPRVGMNVG